MESNPFKMLIGFALICLCASLYQAIFPATHKISHEREIFGYPLLSFAMSIGVAFMLVWPQVIGIYHHGIPTSGSVVVLLLINISIFMFVIFIYRYKVIIENGKVSYGAFGMSEFHMSEVREAVVKSNGRREFLFVYLRTGAKVTFSCYLAGFKSLCEKFKSQAEQNSSNKSFKADAQPLRGRAQP